MRTVALGEDFVLSGSYDLSVKVCPPCSMFMVPELMGCLRFGIEKRVILLQTSLEVIPGVFSVLDLTPKRQVLSVPVL